MRYICAYILAQMGGNENPSVEDMRQIIGSVGAEFEVELAERIVKELKGKDIGELMDEGRFVSFATCALTHYLLTYEIMSQISTY